MLNIIDAPVPAGVRTRAPAVLESLALIAASAVRRGMLIANPLPRVSSSVRSDMVLRLPMSLLAELRSIDQPYLQTCRALWRSSYASSELGVTLNTRGGLIDCATQRHF